MTPRSKTSSQTASKASLSFRKVPDHIQKVAGVLAGLATICGALAGLGKWIVSEVSATTSSRIDSLEQKIDSNQQVNELSTTRLELLMMLEHDSDNVVEIEKLAKHYIIDLGGNTYITGLISRWCAEHDVDPSFLAR